LHELNTHAPAVSQPLLALPSQFENPLLQVPRAQAPPLHVPLALANTQGLLQRPQCVALLEKFASQPSTALLLQSPKPPLHEIPQALPAQVLAALGRVGQAAPQAPQWATELVRLVSQPLPALPSQLPKLVLQAKPQVPEAHVALALLGAAHTLPQRPQFEVDVSVRTSQPSPPLELQSPKPD
jgi:hypothetical protein